MQEVLHYFPELTNCQIDQLGRLEGLYKQWNEQINVISRKDIDQLYTRHVLHSLAIAKYISFAEGTHILDVGTGGGFPGIPLAILFPASHFHLVDSIGKKIKVVQEVTHSIGLGNCTSEHTRAEKVKNKYDFIVTRAVAPLPKLFSWVRHCFKNQAELNPQQGIIALKGGDLESELEPFGRIVKEINISDFFLDAFFETKKIIHLPVSL